MTKVKLSKMEAEELVKKTIESVIDELEKNGQDVLGNLITVMLSASSSVIISNAPNAKEALYMLEKFIERLDEGTKEGIRSFNLT